MKNLLHLKTIILLIAFGLAIFVGNNNVFAQNGCSLVKKNNPLIFISFERILEKDKKKIVQLRLNNNSTCPIVVPVRYEEGSKDTSESKSCIPSTFRVLENNSNILLDYKITDPKTNTIYFPFSGDVGDVALLNGGQSVLFVIPVKNYKKGEFSLDFQYEWEVCNDSQEQMVILHHKLLFHSSELWRLIK